MKTTLSALVALALLSSPAAAADKPNFSGDWKMNAAKSNFGPVPPPASIVRKITHAEPSILIEEVQQGDMGTQNTTRKYTTDGKPMTFESQGANVASSAVWDGNALVVVSNVVEAGLTFNDRMTMAEDGKTCSSVVVISTPQGDLTLTIVFERQ